MKKIFSFVVLFAAVAMVGCCGNCNKKNAAAEEKVCSEKCEQCEKAAECCEKAEGEAACCCEKAAETVAAEAAAVEAAPEAAPAEK